MSSWEVNRTEFDRAVFDRTHGHVTRYFERKGPSVEAAARNNLRQSPLVDPDRRTGELSRSIGWEITGSIAERGMRVFADADHAVFVHEGTPPHDIFVASAPNLVFWWVKEATLFVGKHVNHPGPEANPFLADAVDQVFGADL